MVEVDGLVVLVDAEEADVEIVARVGEVVGIAAEEGDVKFGREHQPHVGVLLVLVEVIDFARVERDHVAAQAGGGGAILFDRAHGDALRLARFRGRHARLGPGVHLGGHVLDPHQNVQFQVRALAFLGPCPRVEAGLHVVGAFGAEFLDAVGADVMVGKGQPVR